MTFENIRNADADFFDQSGILTYRELKHTPIIAFVENEGNINVKVIVKVKEALELPDETKMICEWRGEWRSDYFCFTAAELKAAKLNLGEK